MHHLGPHAEIVGLGLVTQHGIDLQATGIDQPESHVLQEFFQLPSDTFVAVADDTPEEFAKLTDTRASGDWNFHHKNTDGGAIGGLAPSGPWSIDIETDLVKGIDTWSYLDGDTTPIPLEPTATANLRAYAGPSACRLDCTIPRCGDGIIDGGEACDDGNTVGGDGCSADCHSLH